ncbi:hypothetical protein ACHAPU_005216 [Fusarium lateritium]
MLNSTPNPTRVNFREPQGEDRGNPPTRLPSLEEFDQGVEALIRAHGTSKACTPRSPLPGFSRNPIALEPLRSITQPQPSWSLKDRSVEDSPSEYPSSRKGIIASVSQYSISSEYPQQSHLGSYGNPDTYYGYAASSPSVQGLPGMSCYPSPPPDGGEGRHINQKYTTEEGDYIIYAWHDKKMKWLRIKQEFAARFGRTPERTVQGLQAWYYRMNQRIPVWDRDGYLIFDNEDDLEPQHVSIKCRERDSQDKPTEPLGIAQRYPERAIHYSWVDAETKFKSRDWGNELHSTTRGGTDDDTKSSDD